MIEKITLTIYKLSKVNSKEPEPKDGCLCDTCDYENLSPNSEHCKFCNGTSNWEPKKGNYYNEFDKWIGEENADN